MRDLLSVLWITKFTEKLQENLHIINGNLWLLNIEARGQFAVQYELKNLLDNWLISQFFTENGPERQCRIF
jgi:hypothetical protein